MHVHFCTIWFSNFPETFWLCQKLLTQPLRLRQYGVCRILLKALWLKFQTRYFHIYLAELPKTGGKFRHLSKRHFLILLRPPDTAWKEKKKYQQIPRYQLVSEELLYFPDNIVHSVLKIICTGVSCSIF